MKIHSIMMHKIFQEGKRVTFEFIRYFLIMGARLRDANNLTKLKTVL